MAITDTAEKILEIIIANSVKGFSAVGLRGLYDSEGAGEMANSYAWYDGEQTDEEIDGTCAITICHDIDELVNWDEDGEIKADVIKTINRAIFDVAIYGDGAVGLVFGTGSTGGEDQNEIILKGAECVKVYK